MNELQANWFGNLPLGAILKTTSKADTWHKKVSASEAVTQPGERTRGGDRHEWDPTQVVHVPPGTTLAGLITAETADEEGCELLGVRPARH